MATAVVHYFPEFSVLVVRRNGPNDELLTRWSFLQIMEAHPHLCGPTPMRGDEHVRTRTSQGTREIDFNFGVISLFEIRDVQHWSGVGCRHRRATRRNGCCGAARCRCCSYFLSRWTGSH